MKFFLLFYMGVELGLSQYRKYLKGGEGFREECAEEDILD
jgi:hypothetical protein